MWPSAEPGAVSAYLRAELNAMNDLRFAIRSLGRSPGFVLVAVITLALGIGANTSAFSILNALLLRPLPYADSRQLERIYRTTGQVSRGGVSPADYLDLTPQMNGYGEIAAYGVSDMSLSEPGEPAEMARGLRISANLFSTLGTEPQLGRSFRPDETLLGNHRVLIISHRCWQNRFGGDGHIIGRTVRVDGEPHEIVGVLPATLNDWRHLGPFDLYRPLGLTEREKTDRSSTWLRLVGRRSRTLTRAQAEAFIASFGRRLAADFPAANAGSTWRTLPIYDSVIPENAHGIVGMLIGLSGFVLLIACSNLANLLLARTVSRARELAVRSALGASRIRLLRPLFLESLLLAFAGGIGAIQVALWTHDWLNAFQARASGDPLTFALDWRVLGWAFVACLCTALAFGVAPALFALRLDPNSTLKSGSRGTTGDRGHRRFRQFLIAGQFAFAMVLLAGAALFVRGLHDWNNRRFGWESADLVTGTMLLPTTTYPSDKEVADFHRLALERLEALPGVASASVSYSLPFFGLADSRKYVVAGRETPQRGHEPVAVTNGVSPRYFETVGTRVLNGRAFTEADTLASPKVFIINDAMARGLFGGENPLGRQIAPAGGQTIEWGEIVGVVADIQSVSSDRIAAAYQIYQPMAQEPRHGSEIAVRTAGVAPSSLVDGIRTTVMSLDPDLPLRQLQPATATIARAGNYQRIIASILSLLALLGLGLASLGVYGVIARTVAQRTGEFGIRLALGAQARDITRLVLTSGAKLALIGSAVGLVGAFGATRLIVAGFPGLQTSSVPVLTGVTVLLIAIAQIACYIPARKASRISPSEALRAE
jgi:predicted permease